MSKSKKETRIGNLPPRYKFILNPHVETRVSKCPMCNKPTHPRKFAFFIHVEGWGPLAMGKTSKYCSKCELIVLHQDELETELADSFSRIKPEVVGNKYFVIGTVEKKVWQQGLTGQLPPVKEMLDHVADFKQVYDLEFQPAGWYFEG